MVAVRSMPDAHSALEHHLLLTLSALHVQCTHGASLEARTKWIEARVNGALTHVTAQAYSGVILADCQLVQRCLLHFLMTAIVTGTHTHTEKNG